jgi:hypothetical protein
MPFLSSIGTLVVTAVLSFAGMLGIGADGVESIRENGCVFAPAIINTDKTDSLGGAILPPEDAIGSHHRESSRHGNCT